MPEPQPRKPQERPRDPLRNEADTFRLLLMVMGAAAVVIAVSVLIDGRAGAIVALVFLLVGLWRAWGLVRAWRRSGGRLDSES